MYDKHFSKRCLLRPLTYISDDAYAHGMTVNRLSHLQSSTCLFSVASKRVYYGVTDHVNEGTWVCDGTGETIATDTGMGTAGPLFHTSQPDKRDGDSDDCVVGAPRFDYFLADFMCTRPLRYLCEKPSP